MTVRELLIQLRPILPTHEVATLTTYSTDLIIDIEHNHKFHAVGKYSKYKLKHNFSDYEILEPFMHSIYDGYEKGEKKLYSVLDEFEVYRWSIKSDADERIWTLEIETHQT